MAQVARRHARHRVPAPRRRDGPAPARSAKRDDEAHPDYDRDPFEAALDAASSRCSSASNWRSRTLYEVGRLKLWVCGVHLAALWTLAFVQPLFDLLGKNAAFFVARDNTPGDVLIFAFGWTLVPPLVAFAVVALVRAV